VCGWIGDDSCFTGRPSKPRCCVTKIPQAESFSTIGIIRQYRITAPIVFEEFASFTRHVLELPDDEQLADVQELLLTRPDAGKVIPKSGGLRKLRVAAKGHGKRGGGAGDLLLGG
jgi:hypothetical protein